MILMDGWRLAPPHGIGPAGARRTAIGGHWDAWAVKLLADVWQRRHPQP